MSVTYMPLQDVTRSCVVHRNLDMLVGDFGHWFRLSMAHLRMNLGGAYVDQIVWALLGAGQHD